MGEGEKKMNQKQKTRRRRRRLSPINNVEDWEALYVASPTTEDAAVLLEGSVRDLVGEEMAACLWCFFFFFFLSVLASVPRPPSVLIGFVFVSSS